MRPRIAHHPLAHHHQFSLVMQRILRQTEVLMQRRSASVAQETASLDGLEVRESTWDEWAEAVGDLPTR